MKTRRKTNKRTERRQDIKLGKIRTQDNYNNQKKQQTENTKTKQGKGPTVLRANIVFCRLAQKYLVQTEHFFAWPKRKKKTKE